MAAGRLGLTVAAVGATVAVQQQLHSIYAYPRKTVVAWQNDIAQLDQLEQVHHALANFCFNRTAMTWPHAQAKSNIFKDCEVPK